MRNLDPKMRDVESWNSGSIADFTNACTPSQPSKEVEQQEAPAATSFKEAAVAIFFSAIIVGLVGHVAVKGIANVAAVSLATHTASGW